MGNCALPKVVGNKPCIVELGMVLVVKRKWCIEELCIMLWSARELCIVGMLHGVVLARKGTQL